MKKLCMSTVSTKAQLFKNNKGTQQTYPLSAGTTALIFVEYWTYAALFSLMDITNRPKFLRKYKLQPGTNEPVDSKKLKNVCTYFFTIKHFLQFFRIFLGHQNSAHKPNNSRNSSALHFLSRVIEAHAKVISTSATICLNNATSNSCFSRA